MPLLPTHLDHAAVAPSLLRACLLKDVWSSHVCACEQLRMELSAQAAELAQAQAQVSQRITETATVETQLTTERARAPTEQMSARVSQLQATVKSRERELTKLRGMLLLPLPLVPHGPIGT